MNEEVEKCHKATFVALPITVEMTAGTLHSAWQPMPTTVKSHYNSIRIKLMFYVVLINKVNVKVKKRTYRTHGSFIQF